MIGLMSASGRVTNGLRQQAGPITSLRECPPRGSVQVWRRAGLRCAGSVLHRAELCRMRRLGPSLPGGVSNHGSLQVLPSRRPSPRCRLFFLPSRERNRLRPCRGHGSSANSESSCGKFGIKPRARMVSSCAAVDRVDLEALSCNLFSSFQNCAR